MKFRDPPCSSTVPLAPGARVDQVLNERRSADAWYHAPIDGVKIRYDVPPLRSEVPIFLSSLKTQAPSGRFDFMSTFLDDRDPRVLPQTFLGWSPLRLSNLGTWTPCRVTAWHLVESEVTGWLPVWATGFDRNQSAWSLGLRSIRKIIELGEPPRVAARTWYFPNTPFFSFSPVAAQRVEIFHGARGSLPGDHA
jgi:hypothetical protein